MALNLLSNLSEGQFIVTAVNSDNAYGPVQLWRKDGTLVKTLIGENQGKGKINVYTSERGPTLVTSIQGENFLGPVKLWATDGTVASTLIEEKQDQEANIKVDVSRNGQILVTSMSGKYFYGPVQLWRADGTLIKTLIEYEPIENSDSKSVTISFNKNNQTLITNISSYNHDNGYHGTVQLWQADGTYLTTLIKESPSRTTVIFSPNSKLLVTKTIDGSPVELWHADGKHIQTLIEKSDGICNVTFSSDGKIVAVACQNGLVKIWQASNNKLITFKTETKLTSSFEFKFSPDNTILVFMDNKKTRLLRFDGNLDKTLKHDGYISDIVFSPNNQMVATASYDNTIKLWHRDGTFISTLRGHTSQVTGGLFFSHDGNRLISADENRQVIIYHLKGFIELDDLRKHGCQWVSSYINSSDVEDEYRDICDGVQY